MTTVRSSKRSAQRPKGCNPSASQSEPSRVGFTVIELVLALGLLVVFFAMFVPLLGIITRERRMSAQEQAALQHAANVLDDLSRRSYAELSDQNEIALPDHVRQMLPAVEQTVTITPMAGEPAAKQVSVSLRWQQAGGTWSHPVTLTAWVHAPAGGAP
jgi:type II secretory pathway pseudopilin PulG